MNEPFQVLSLKPYFDIIYRHRLVALGALAVGLGITVCLVTMLPNIYRCSTELLMEPQQVASAYVTAPAAVNVSNRIRLLNEEALSDEQLQQIIRQLNLYPAQRAAGEPLDELTDRMRRHISIDFGTPDEAGRINSFKISFEYPRASVAQNVTQHLADAYINQDLRDRTSQALAASQFLEDQVIAARAKLESKSNQLKTYEVRYAGSLPQDLEFNVQQLGILEGQLAAVNRDRDVLAVNQNAAQQVSPEARLRRMEGQLATMRAQYSDRYPDVRALRSEIASLKQAIAASAAAGPSDEVKQQELNAAGTKNRLADNVSSLQAAIAEYRKRIAEAPQHQQALSALQRDDQILAADYEQLLHKQLEAQTSAQLEERQEGGRLRILDPPVLPLTPVRPKRIAIAIIGVCLSLLAAVGLPFAFYFTDTSFKQPDELSREYGLPVLVTITLEGETAGRGQRRWAALRAIALSGLMLMVSATAIWVYATRIF